MTDEKCGYHHEDYCLKGLPGTPCEVRGCVAHTTSKKNMKEEESSPLCRQCSRFETCFAETSDKPFRQELMKGRMYCSCFDNKDKSSRLFPFLQPYEVDVFNAVDKKTYE